MNTRSDSFVSNKDSNVVVVVVVNYNSISGVKDVSKEDRSQRTKKRFYSGSHSVILAQAWTCGQSYKHFTVVNYDPRVVIWGIFKSGTTLES